MKRTIAIIAASALVLTSAVALAGCGSEESSADTQATTVAAATEAQQSSERRYFRRGRGFHLQRRER